jgi:HlyD family secretion protein
MMKKLVLLLLTGTLLLTGCSGSSTAEPAATEATAATHSIGGDVVAEATIEPARWSELRFEISGTVAEVLVEPGDEVKAGDVLVRLDATDAELGVLEARSALAATKSELALLEAGPRAEEIAGAEAELDAAKAALARAIAGRDQLTGGATEAEIAAAEAEVTAAEAQQLMTRDERDDVHKQSDDDRAKEDADYRLYAANQALAAAQAKLEILQNIADDKVRAAQAGLWSASAQRDVAQAGLDLLKAGAAPWEVASAEAAVRQAEAALAAAEVALARTAIRAPFDGTVTKVNVEVGNTVTPGVEVVAVVGALDELQARTIDLTELDVARVAEGQAATVTVDALPDETFTGVVSEIALRAGDYRGDVVYAVTVELADGADGQLRWGMTALVEIQTD